MIVLAAVLRNEGDERRQKVIVRRQRQVSQVGLLTPQANSDYRDGGGQ